jgi:hypothetical protein
MTEKSNRTPIIVAVITGSATVVAAVIAKIRVDSGKLSSAPPVVAASAPHATLRAYAPVTFAEIAALCRDMSRTAVQKDDELNKFIGKWVIWRGYVRDVVQDGDRFYVIATIAKGRPESSPNVMLVLASAEKELLKKLAFEDEIEFEGLLARQGTMDVKLQDAVIIRKL